MIRRKSLMLLFVCDHLIELRFDCLKLMSLDPMIYTNQINHINNCFKQCRSTACYCMNHLSLIVFQVCLSNMLWYRIENYAFKIVKKRMFPNLYTMIYIFCMLIFFDKFLFENQFFSLKIFFWKIWISRRAVPSAHCLWIFFLLYNRVLRLLMKWLNKL